MAHDIAKAAARKTRPECVFTGLKQFRTGAHIFPVSRFPELADEPLNIVSMNERIHFLNVPSFDWLENGNYRPEGEKLHLLLHYSMSEYRAELHEQLEQLAEVCDKKGIEWPVSFAPSDLLQLLHAYRLS